ncbi:MAG: acetyl-CoA carboxylase biotin carboxyl carrier protein subunit [Propionibacteriaceae bacterium]|jgi:biotin carboxyl carrier protein|nr:acetyl-CoA carboxylase biotin carboxyl carrier protein subunit [Propionibacteriaceae bacterium]
MSRYIINLPNGRHVVDVTRSGADEYTVVVDGDSPVSPPGAVSSPGVPPAVAGIAESLSQRVAPTAPPPLAHAAALPTAVVPSSGAAVAPPAGPPSAAPLAAAPPAAAPGPGGDPADPGVPLTAPLPGVVDRLLVAVGDSVSPGQPVIVLEAMKMKNDLCASHTGVVSAIAVTAGQTVGFGQSLLVISRTGR